MARAGELLVGRYRLIRAIGAGGMGSVWWARDERIGRDVAIKLSPSEGEGAVDPRFVREAHIAAQVCHPNVVGVLDAGEAAPQRLFLVMELLRGESLAERLHPRDPLDVVETLAIGIAVCRGLEAIHARGIVHRDVKPENIFLADVPGEGRVPKLLDFGISSRGQGSARSRWRASVGPSGRASEGTTRVVGTPGYMSPEQARGEEDVDGRADLWALGSVLYEALAGRPPFEGTDVDAMIEAVLTDYPAPLSAWVPEDVAQIVARCLEKDPRRRYADARALRLALEDALSDLAGSSPSSAAFARTRGPSLIPPPRDGRNQAAGFGLAAALLLFGMMTLPALDHARRAAATVLHATVGERVTAAAGRVTEMAREGSHDERR